MEQLGIKLIVEEKSGIRRFLYPLCVRIPSVYRRSAGKLALMDEGADLIPSHISNGPLGVQCVFALSMSPLEIRELALVRVDNSDHVAIPDPLKIEFFADSVVSRQERVELRFDRSALLTSVIYDEIEHLAGPLAIALDNEPFTGKPGQMPSRLDHPPSGLYAELFQSGSYDEADDQATAETSVDLTACKSWVTARHIIANPNPGAVLRYRLPLVLSSPVQTCDFGAGNGAYGKIEAGVVDELIWEIDLSTGPARYRIRSRLGSGEVRSDYAGEYKNLAELAPHLWLHWNEPIKALALAITDVPIGCDSIVITIHTDGVLNVEFTLGPQIAEPAEFSVCYHFLNDIPPIAAATNPASILLPPKVSVSKI